MDSCASFRTRTMVRTILEDVLTGVKDTITPAACKWMWITNVALRDWYGQLLQKQCSASHLLNLVPADLPEHLHQPASPFVLVSHVNESVTSKAQHQTLCQELADQLNLNFHYDTSIGLGLFYDEELFTTPIGITQLWLRTVHTTDQSSTMGQNMTTCPASLTAENLQTLGEDTQLSTIGSMSSPIASPTKSTVSDLLMQFLEKT